MVLSWPRKPFYQWHLNINQWNLSSHEQSIVLSFIHSKKIKLFCSLSSKQSLNENIRRKFGPFTRRQTHSPNIYESLLFAFCLVTASHVTRFGFENRQNAIFQFWLNPLCFSTQLYKSELHPQRNYNIGCLL